jgi:hypothetical protein
MPKTKICTRCGIPKPLTEFHRDSRSRDCRQSECRSCSSVYHREYYLRRTPNSHRYPRQHPNQNHTFACGCAGILPARSTANQFACWNTDGRFGCRITRILSSSANKAKERGHQPIPSDTPHSIIRALMLEPNCERCHQPLSWDFGLNKTPHLHHDHQTGKPLGFVHPRCNPQAMEDEIDRQRDEIASLRSRLVMTT